MKSRLFCYLFKRSGGLIRHSLHDPARTAIGNATATHEPAVAPPSAIVRSLRPNFPYSVIAGGAYSPGELRFADNKDAVVRAHYADFDISHAKMMTLTDDRFEYVSYRVQNQIYWTKNKLRIPKGELLLSDGHNYARARCGNRLSDQQHKSAASAHEPHSALLSLPPVTIQTLPELALAEPPALEGIPGTAIPLESRSGAATPAPEYSQPLVPLEPAAGGGQSSVGGSFVSGNSFVPVAPAPLRVVSTGGTPTIPAPPPTTPVSPPTTPPVAPIPEPSTVYLFLVSLVISLGALLRISQKDKSEN